MIWQSPLGYTLKTRRELRTLNVFHQIQAYLLFPPECACVDSCSCEDRRSQIVRLLHVDFYNCAVQESQPVEFLRALKFFLDIPEDEILRKDYADVYPCWLIREKFQERIDTKEFQCIFELVMTYERLFGGRQASLKEALEILLGKTPLGSVKRHNPERYFGGEKTCMEHWYKYRSVSHCVAALGSVVELLNPFWTSRSLKWPIS